MKFDKEYIYRHLKQFDLIKEIGCFIVSNLKPFGSQDFQTLLITRFNLGNNPLAIADEYLKERMEIFDRYTFPSVNSQTDVNFEWIILLNSQTPSKYKELFEEYKKQSRMKLTVVYTERGKSATDIKETISDYLDSSRYIFTLRCDNDDMLAKNYIKEMKKNFRPIHNMYIDFIYGYNLDNDNNIVNIYKCRANHFIGYVEDSKKREPETVYNHDHSLCKLYGWVRRIKNRNYPLWCEIIHGSNIMNTI